MTMIDTMISVAILLVLSTFTVVSMRNAVQLNGFMKSQDNASRAVLVKLRHQLQLAFLTTDLSTTESYVTVFVGQDQDPDQLYFATRSHQRMYRDARESDQAEITVWAERMPDVDGLEGEGYVIYHREAPRIDDEPGKGGTVHPLAYNVKEFSLRYLDGQKNEWVDEWDSRASDYLNRLPRAVEIAMVVNFPDPRHAGDWIEKPQKTTVALQFAEPLASSNQQGGGR
ncbi:MAG: general secretion pathway protein J [Kiritimatiellia bacterium]|jgi:general secretion pathway protein J